MLERIKKGVKLVTGIFVFVFSLGLIGCATESGDSGSDHPPIGNSIPDVVGITAKAGDGEVLISWYVPNYPGITKFTITYGDSQSVDASEYENSKRITGLTNGIEYTFTIKTVTASGSSKGVSVKAVPMPGLTPFGDVPDVAVFTAKAGDGKVDLSWYVPNYPEITKFTITYGDSQSVDVLSYVDSKTITGLTNDKEYTFTIKTVTANGSSKGVSAKATPKAVKTDETIPNPSNFYARAGDCSITLNWNVPESEAIKGYKIFYDDDKSVDIDYPRSNSKEIKGLTNGKEYTFTIKSVTDTGISTGVTTKGTPVSADEVYNLKAVSGENFVYLKWDDVDYYATYIIYKNGEKIEDYCSINYYTVENLTYGEEYTFKVAKKLYGEGKNESDGVEVKVTVSPDPLRFPNIKNLKAEVKLDLKTLKHYVHFTYGDVDYPDDSDVGTWMNAFVSVDGGAEVRAGISQGFFDYKEIPVYSEDTEIPVEFNIRYTDNSMYPSGHDVFVKNCFNVTVPKLEEYIPYSYDETIQNQTIELEEKFNENMFRTYNGGYGYNGSLKSSMDGIASVEGTQQIKGVSLGKVKIYYEFPIKDVEGNDITVKQYRDFEVIKKQVKNIDFGRTMPLFVKKGADPVTLDVTLSPDDLDDEVKGLTWSSSNESVATVNNGTISFGNEGYADISAKAISGVTKHLFVCVVPDETTISEMYNDKRIHYKDYEGNEEKYTKWKNAFTEHESNEGLLAYEVTMSNLDVASLASNNGKNFGRIEFTDIDGSGLNIITNTDALELYNKTESQDFKYAGIEKNLLEYNSIGEIDVAIKPVVYKDKIVVYYVISNNTDKEKSDVVYSRLGLKGNCHSFKTNETFTSATATYERYSLNYSGTSEITVDLNGYEDVQGVSNAHIQYGGMLSSNYFTQSGFKYEDFSDSTIGDVMPYICYSYNVEKLAPHTSKLYCITLSTKHEVQD